METERQAFRQLIAMHEREPTIMSESFACMPPLGTFLTQRGLASSPPLPVHSTLGSAGEYSSAWSPPPPSIAAR